MTNRFPPPPAQTATTSERPLAVVRAHVIRLSPRPQASPAVPPDEAA